MLTRHIVDIAQAFNRFYHDEHILVDDEKEKISKLALVTAAKTAIENGLALLGMERPRCHLRESDMMWDWGISEAVIREITEIAKRNQIQEIILFGSRARGDYNRTSDIDLAVTGGNISSFAVSIEETSTLLEYDIVDLDKPVSEELLKSIRDEGKILYEKT